MKDYREEAGSVHHLYNQVEPLKIEGIIRRLAEFHTRNTLSSGYQDAVNWMEEQFAAIEGMAVERRRTPLPAGKRIFTPLDSVQLLATLQGETDEPALLIGAHLDSLNLKSHDENPRAPGANDNGSGIAVMLECARLLATLPSRRRTIYFAAFTAEEQGLLGSKHLAAVLHAEGVQLQAVLTSDMVGNTFCQEGRRESSRVRCFSAEGPSRDLARWIAWMADHNIAGFSVDLVLRHDRFGRGGDHTPFQQIGYPAVRFTEAVEEYRRQHTADDLPEFVDFHYAAGTTRVNLMALCALCQSGPPPINPEIVLDQSHSTTVRWKPRETPVRIFWRQTSSAKWQGSTIGVGGQATLDGINKDDHIFGIGQENAPPIELG